MRLMPFLFVLYIIAYLDRVNISFANLEMSKALRFSDLHLCRLAEPSAHRAFEREQALFGDEPALAAIAAEPALRQHAVAGDDDRDRVLAAGAADRAWRRADGRSKIAVTAGLAIGNCLHRRPDPRLEW